MIHAPQNAKDGSDDLLRTAVRCRRYGPFSSSDAMRDVGLAYGLTAEEVNEWLTEAGRL